MAAVQQQQQFHWVHRDASRASSSPKGQDRTAIHRFVQHQRIIARKHGELQIKFSKDVDRRLRSPSSSSSTAVVQSSRESTVSSATSPETLSSTERSVVICSFCSS
jgi:hypothetical protein